MSEEEQSGSESGSEEEFVDDADPSERSLIKLPSINFICAPPNSGKTVKTL